MRWMNENQTKNNRIVNMRGRKKRTRAMREDKWIVDVRSETKIYSEVKIRWSKLRKKIGKEKSREDVMSWYVGRDYLYKSRYSIC